MKHGNRVKEILSAGALAVGVTLAPQIAPATGPAESPPTAPAFDAEGRVVSLGTALTEKFQKSDLAIPHPVPVGENKVNAMCLCRKN